MFIKTQSILKKHNCSMLLIVKNAMHSLCIYKMQSVHIAEFVNGGGGGGGGGVDPGARLHC